MKDYNLTLRNLRVSHTLKIFEQYLANKTKITIAILKSTEKKNSSFGFEGAGTEDCETADIMLGVSN